ncbi:MAG: hypothetical protein R2839_01575 [Thermomicrobiales bacterium]
MFDRVPRFLHFVIAVTLVAIAVFLPMSMSARAQDGEGAAAAEGSPETATAVGWLQVVAVTCEVTEGANSVSIALAAEFVPDASCYDGWSAIWIDDIDYGAAAPVLEIELAAGAHTLTDPASGVSRVVDLPADVLTVVYLVTTTVIPDETPAAVADEAPIETTALSVVTHICDPAIQDVDALLALGDRSARLATCPVLTLPEMYAPENSVTAGQAWFDLTIADGADFSAALSGGTFVPTAVCESELGVQLSSNPYDDACFSTSGITVEVPRSGLTLTMTDLPELHRFGFAESGDDVAQVWVIDPNAGIAGADLSASGESAIVHVYLFAPPRLTIVQHVCGVEVTSPDALQQMSGFLERVTICPAVTRDALSLDATIADGWGATHYLSSSVPHMQSFCEADLGFDIDGVSNNNACLDMAAYAIENVARGAVEIYPVLPEGFALAGFDFTPGTNDASTFLSADLTTPVVALDTSLDGNVTVHLYAMAAAAQSSPTATSTPTSTATVVMPSATATVAQPSATATQTVPTMTPTTASTATATATPPVTNTGGTGTLQIIALYCLGSKNSTTLTALAPGQMAGQTLLGGQCFAGDARVQLTMAGENPAAPIQLGRDGVAWVERIRTTGNDRHAIADLVSGRAATFAIERDTVTRVVLRIEAALGSTTLGTASESGRPGGGTGVNPSDLIGLPGTDVLVTDELNYFDAGEAMAGSYDSERLRGRSARRSGRR